MTSDPGSSHLATGGMGRGDQYNANDDSRPETVVAGVTDTNHDLTNDDSQRELVPAEGTNLGRDIANDDSHPALATAEATDLGPQERELAKPPSGADWHDIQAMFVDDPRGSVQSAAEKAEAAVSALGEVLRMRRSALDMAASGAPSTAGETEELREMLRTYRIFCQNLADLEGELQDPAAMTG